MKRILCIFLVFAILSAIGSVLSSCFPIVEEPEEKTAVYEEWNALLAAGFSTVALRTEWHDGRDVLQGEYDLTRTADGEYTVSFRSERFSVFDTESEAIPEDYITAATGSATIRAGQIAVQSGDAPDLSVGKLLLSDLHFSEKSLQETRADGARLTARVADPQEFFGLRGVAEMTVEVERGETSLVSLLISYTVDGAEVTYMYRFS